MAWIFMPSRQQIYVEILIADVMILGGWAFGRWLGYKGGALINGISALVKETPVSSVAPSTKWGYNKKSTTRKEPPTIMQAPWSQTSNLQNCGK